MGKIPTYNAQLSFKGNQAEAEAMGGIGEALFGIGQKFQKARQDIEIGQATIAATKGVNEIELAASQDTETRGYQDRHFKAISELRNSLSNSFRDREAQAAFLQKFDVDAENTKLKIKQYDYKNIQEEGLATLHEKVNVEADAYTKETIPEFKKIKLDNIAKYYIDAADKGFITKDKAYESIRKVGEELPEKQAKWDIQNNVDYAISELTKGERGEYKGLPSEKRSELLKDAENEKEKILKQEKINLIIAQDENEDNLVNMLLKKDPGLTEDFINSATVRPEFAKSMVGNLKSVKKIGAKTKTAKFVGFVNDMLYNKIKPKDIEIALMEANTTGAISDEDFDLLVTFNRDVNMSQITEKILPNVSFAKGLQYWGDENAGAREESKQRMFRNYMTKIKNGIDPETASAETIKEEVLTLFPQAKNAPKEGINIVDLNGVIKHITPDGELTIVKRKK